MRMALGTAPPPAPAPRRSSAEDEQLDRFIAERIGRTRNEVRLVEVFAGMMTWLASVLACLMALVVCDHWLVSGGLGFWPRMLALGTLWVGSVVYGYRRIAPWMSGRINPVYAAQAIEQSRPGLKNSLINFLLLRPERSELPAGVYQALEQRAASDLSHVPAEGTVDRTHLVRISYSLLAVVVICCLYKLLSPKDPLTSMARLLVPWSSWNAPTRVSIADVEPGDTRAFHDEFVEVSAVVRGVRRGEPVTLFYSTEDGQTVDQAIEMTLPADSYRYRATLPAGAKGLQQTVSYYLAAGDARSATHRVEVQTAPAILVQQVDYDYPAYTGLADRSVQRQGDLRAIQGTQVTIIAAANRDIAKADLDFDCDGTSDLKVKVEGRQAVASFALNLGKDNKPEHASYQLRFTDPDGKNNPQPIRHRVEVQADEPPQVEIVQPTEGETQLAANGVLLMAVRARDPDFALRTVTLLAERGGERIVEEQLLSVPHTGEFRGTYLFDAAQQKLKPGQEVLYWAEARDSRQPVANSTVTNKFKLQIVAETNADERRTQRAVADQAQRDMQDQPAPDKLPNDAGDPAVANDKAQGRDRDAADDSGGADEADPADATAERGQPPAENSDQPDAADGPERRDPNESGRQEEDTGRDEQTKPGEQSQGEKSQGEQEQGQQGQGEKGQGEKGQGEQGKGDGAQGDKGRPGSDKANDSTGGKQNGGEKQKGGDKQNGDDRSGAAEQNRAGKKEVPEKQSGRPERIDPEANPGEAFEKLLKRAQEQQSKAGQSKPDQQQPGSGSSPEQQQQQQQRQQPQPNKDQGPQNGKQPPGDQSTGEEGQTGQNNPAGQQPGQAGKKQAGQGQNGDADKPQSDSQGDADDEGESGSERSPGADKQQGQGAPSGGKPSPQPGKKPPGGGQEELADDQSPDDQPAEGETNVDGQGQGAKQTAQDQNRDAKQGEGQPNKQGEGEKPAGKQGGKPPQNQGQPGAGQQDSDSSSGPGKEQPTRDRPKNQGAGNPSNQQGKGGEPPAPSDSKSESDSQGSEGGDRSGGGKKGGGQQSQQAGKGAPGSSTESDEGAAAKGGNEQGQPGDASSDGKQGTGQGGKPAPGSGQSASGGKPTAGGGPGSSGQATGQAPASGQDGAGSSGGSPAQGNPQGASGQNSNDARPGDKQGNQGPGGGGEPAPGSDPAGAAPPAAQRGDEPNVEYARKATDLVLDYLKNKRNSAGQDEALRELNWSPADLQKFIDRWERMKAEAQQPGEAGQEAQKRLDDALRGLGLVPEQTRLEASTRKEAGARSVGPTRRSEPPSEYADQFRAYTRGAARQPAAKPAAKKP